MNIVFRADANKNIGMGHIMRCLSIADAFSKASCQVKFLIADDGVLGLINDRGYKAIVLNSNHQKMEEEQWPNDINEDIIIVDSYFVTAEYLQSLCDKMKSCHGKLVYIDDIYAFPYPVDIVIDYNAYATPAIYDDLYSGSTVKKPQLILGPIYAPLRSMFCGVNKKIQPDKVENILISTGGSDVLHLTLAIIKSILSDSIVRTDRIYHFLLGAMNADKEKIKKVASEKKSIVIHENVTDMKTLISSSDLAISAAGSTIYEIASCGIPLITYSLADNQLSGAEAFERLGLAVNVGDLRNPSSIDPTSIMSDMLDKSAVERVLYAAELLAQDKLRRCEIGKQMQEMIDGFGAERMVHKILSLV